MKNPVFVLLNKNGHGFHLPCDMPFHVLRHFVAEYLKDFAGNKT